MESKVFKELKHYIYPLKDSEGEYYGEYTISKNAKPLGFKGEKLVEVYVLDLRSHKWHILSR